MSATATTSNILSWSCFAIPLKLVAVVLFLQMIFSSVLVSAEMISSNSADCPSSSSCSVSIGLKISVTFNVLLLVCCFFRWVALREEIIHHGGMGSEIDSAEDRTNSDLNDSIIDDVEWVEDKLWETNTLESNVNCLVKDLSIPQVEPVKEVKGYKKELVMEADPFMKVEGYEGYEGYEVYEGTLDDRLVAVKKIPLSENSLEIAKNEKTIHYACQDNSSNIMRLYDFDVTTDSFIYIYFQRWECTFGDLIRFCSRETTSSSLHEKQKSYLNKFKEENTLWENSSPSNLLRDLIRQLLVGVADLHSHGILHRNINESSFFIIFNENRITVKLGDLSMGKLRKGKALVELIQFAPKEENNTGGLTDDIFFLGCVVGFSFAHGQHIFKNTFLDPSVLIHNDRAMDIVQQAPEAHYLVQNLIAPHENRLTAERALAQPFFWPCQKKVQFCDLANSRVLGDVLERSFWDSAKKAAKKVWKGKNWDEKLDGALTDEIANAKDFVRASYHTYDFPDLVRYMRNTLSHCHENSAACKEIVGISQESIFEYFTKKFPQLLVQLHTIVFEHFQTEEDFVFYFTDKGTF